MDLSEFLSEWNSPESCVRVRTSGSTGKPKPLLVEKSRMIASAQMTCNFLGLKRGDSALLCMPLDYIAGKMVVVRSLVCGLRLICVEPSSHPLSGLSETPDFVAMVPLQVVRTLEREDEAAMLRNVKNLIIGGGSIDSTLETKLREFPNAVWSTYGMTETLSHIALRRISGAESSLWYTPFEGITVSLTEDNTLRIFAPMLCVDELVTNDIAEMNAEGQFRILGRKDNVINSGGVKIQIEEVERLIRESLMADSEANVTTTHRLSELFRITSRKDVDFGEVVVAVVDSSITSEQLLQFKCAFTSLPRYWRPKCIVFTDSLPVTETGKPDRAETKRIANISLSHNI